MNVFFGVIVGLLVLMFLVTAHEFGHFIMARKNGVRVLEFGIGFPPRAAAWVKDPETHKWRKLKKSEWEKAGITKTVISEGSGANEADGENKKIKDNKKIVADGLVFSLNWLPIGGFCQMDGESAEDRRPGTFGNANFWKKTKILFGGVAMNWVVAFVILTILAWAGMPTFLPNQFTVDTDTRYEGGAVRVAEVLTGSPAETAGILVGDTILGINDAVVARGNDVTEFNAAHAGEQVIYKIKRLEEKCSGEDETRTCENAEVVHEFPVTLNSAEADYKLGVSMSMSQELSYSTWSAPIVGAGVTLQITGETFKGVGELLWNLVTGTGRLFSFDANVRESGQEAIQTVGNSVSGPVGIIGILFPSFTAAGFNNLMFLTALISISLACMNVLPIPALDGGRWLLIGFYKIRKKRLTKEVEQKIVARAMFVLLALMAIVTILDITRFF